MTFKPNLSVKETLDLLAQRLDPIIAAKLAPELDGHPWTVLLDFLDEKRGRTRMTGYERTDLLPQLRILTERLGNLGYPFDNDDRLVSTTAGKLRIYRNRSSHQGSITVFDAYRASDAAFELLRYFGDEEGLAEAERLRREALTALAKHEGVSEDSAEKSASMPPPPDEDDPAVEDDKDSESVEPDPEVLERDAEESEELLLGPERLEYEPWQVVSIGDPDVLNHLTNQSAKNEVRSVANEIASQEGPVHVDRLARLVARSFNWRRLTKSRRQAIIRQVRGAGLYIDEDSFVWPSEIDPNRWTEFRPNDSSARRFFFEISPIEIANAARFIKQRHPEISDRDLEAAVLQTFGKKNRTRKRLGHLKKVKEIL